jgi:transcriptional regulator with XRE-family HTH domain
MCDTVRRMAKTTVSPSLLYAALDAVRQARGVSWRALAKDIGVSPSLLSRLGNGLKPDADGFATIVAWLNVPAEQFFDHGGSPASDEGAQPDLMAQLAPLLRARKDLNETDVKYLEQVIGATIQRARAQ